MTLIGYLGCTCIGLVWGWLMGRLNFWTFIRSSEGPRLGAGFILLSIQTYLFTSRWSLIFFWGATILAFAVHAEWLGRLRIRFKPKKSEGGI